VQILCCNIVRPHAENRSEVGIQLAIVVRRPLSRVAHKNAIACAKVVIHPREILVLIEK
jgi:hypothetical protein